MLTLKETMEQELNGLYPENFTVRNARNSTDGQTFTIASIDSALFDSPDVVAILNKYGHLWR